MSQKIRVKFFWASRDFSVVERTHNFPIWARLSIWRHVNLLMLPKQVGMIPYEYGLKILFPWCERIPPYWEMAWKEKKGRYVSWQWMFWLYIFNFKIYLPLKDFVQIVRRVGRMQIKWTHRFILIQKELNKKLPFSILIFHPFLLTEKYQNEARSDLGS